MKISMSRESCEEKGLDSPNNTAKGTRRLDRVRSTLTMIVVED